MPLDPTQPAPTSTPPADTTPPAGSPSSSEGAAAAPQAGQVVTFRFTDTVTGGEITGAGIVVRSAAGGVSVAPIAQLRYDLAPNQVTAVPQADDALDAQG